MSKYIVLVTETTYDDGRYLKRFGTVYTDAPTKARAVCNARFRTEGRAFGDKIYGNEFYWKAYTYTAMLPDEFKSWKEAHNDACKQAV